MSKKSKRRRQRVDIRSVEDVNDYDYDDSDMDDLARDIYSTEWGDSYDQGERLSARRKIERRREEKQLYSELDGWEEFGLNFED